MAEMNAAGVRAPWFRPRLADCLKDYSREKFFADLLAGLTVLDATALNALESLHEKLRHHKKHLIVSGPHTQPYVVMAQAGFLDRVGKANVCADLESAVARARELVGQT